MRKAYGIILPLLLLPIIMMGQSDTVYFSRHGGFYDHGFALTLQSAAGHTVRYTVNGATPSATSRLYEGPVFLDGQCLSTSNIHTIVNSIPSTFHPVSDVKRAVVIRAAAFDDAGNCVSATVTNTYVIKDLGGDTHGMPVVSIAADSLDLFDYDTGIFVPGVNYDPADSTHTGNYCQRGREWERVINVEFYETNNYGVNQRCGLRTHGGASRWFQQKGLRLYAREEYGKKRFKHAFFVNTPLRSFKHLNLHPFRCSNWLQTGGQDYLSHRVADGLDVDALAVREVALYINGEYWGIYTLEESPDERYLEDHYEADLEQVNILKYWAVPQYGDPTDCRNFREWLKNADLSQPEDSAYAFAHVDMPSFVDYLLLEMYGANLDWPQNNVLIWQMATGEPFRMLFYDGDGCFTRWYHPSIYNAMHQGGNSLFFNHFLDCEGFRKMLQDRYFELAETVFRYESLMEIWDEYRAAVEEEVPDQSDRFGFPRNMQRWQSDMDSTEAFFVKRKAAFGRDLFELLAVDEVVVANGLTAYPNPNHGTFYIRLEADEPASCPVEIIDGMGRRVFAEECRLSSGENEVRISTGLSPGLYLVKIGNATKRIIIQ